MGGALVGVVSCESLFHTVTSGLQSVAVFYYENGTARITCSFASGSLSSGCQVSLSGDQLHYSYYPYILMPTLPKKFTLRDDCSIFFPFRRGDATEATDYLAIAKAPSTVEGRDMETEDPISISGTISSENPVSSEDPTSNLGSGSTTSGIIIVCLNNHLWMMLARELKSIIIIEGR